jgi:hypothetical protein
LDKVCAPKDDYLAVITAYLPDINRSKIDLAGFLCFNPLLIP